MRFRRLWNILRGDMSVIGPRPALWNQEDLLAERDKYGANDVKPGLSGWAQICGRDELEISDKARLDGEYVQRMSLSALIAAASSNGHFRIERRRRGGGRHREPAQDGEQEMKILIATNHSYMFYRFRKEPGGGVDAGARGHSQHALCGA